MNERLFRHSCLEELKKVRSKSPEKANSHLQY